MRPSRTARSTGELRASVLVAVALSVSVFLSVFFGIPEESASAHEVATDPVLIGAGDIATCNGTGDEDTVDLITNIASDNADGRTTVFTAGDNVYPDGTDEDFERCYKPSWSWGDHKEITKPSVGNHEYNTPGASGYFGYFGAAAGDPAKGYYSYDLGNWHIVVLNSNCSDPTAPACAAGSPQEQWLENDLAAHPNTCTLAYWHHPRFSSGNHGDDVDVAPFWKALYQAGADVVLNGHDHTYERFAPQNPSGQADPAQGIREFVVGTGGAALTTFKSIQPNSVARIAKEHGVLKLTLHPEGYDWEFVTTPDETVADSGNGKCFGAPDPSPTDTTAPAVQPPQQVLPRSLWLGTSTIPTELRWSATDDQSGVASYELQQSVNGGAFTNVSLASATSTAKTLQLQPGNTYQFRVRATDGADNTSDWFTTDPPAFVVEAHQETDSAAIDYAGSWNQQALSSAFGGGLRYASAEGSSAQFTFTGHNVAWVSTKAPNMGMARVYIDGMGAKTVDLYRPSTTGDIQKDRKIVFSQSGLDPAVSHTITVQVLGTKHTASSGTQVDVDAFAVLR
jgi:hypothetical protein